jgi:hypothetical protein
MAEDLQLYEARLHEIIKAIKRQTDTQLTIEWKKWLDAHTSEDLATGVSSMLTDAMKTMLGANEPPTVAEIQTLPPVADKRSPGVYFGLILPILGEEADENAFGYVGSATRVGRGLQGRVPDHLSASYRQKYLERTPNYYHYRLLEDGSRDESCYVFAETE